MAEVATTPDLEELSKPVPKEKIEEDIAIMEMGLVLRNEGEEPKNLLQLVKQGAFKHLTAIDLDDKKQADVVWGTHRALAKAVTAVSEGRLMLTRKWDDYKAKLIAREKEVISPLKAESDRLRAIHDQWEKSREERAAEEEKREQARVQARVKRILDTGAFFNEETADYTLGSIVVNSVQVKILDDAAFEASVGLMEKEGERLAEEERKRQEAERRYQFRISQSYTAGATYNGIVYFHPHSDQDVSDQEIRDMSEQEWETLLGTWKAATEEQERAKEEAEQKRKAEEVQKEENEKRLAAMRTRLANANAKDLVAAGWEMGDFGVSVKLDVPGVGVTEFMLNTIADWTDEELLKYITLGNACVQERERVSAALAAEKARFAKLDSVEVGSVEYPDGNVGFGGKTMAKGAMLAMSDEAFDTWVKEVKQEREKFDQEKAKHPPMAGTWGTEDINEFLPDRPAQEASIGGATEQEHAAAVQEERAERTGEGWSDPGFQVSNSEVLNGSTPPVPSGWVEEDRRIADAKQDVFEQPKEGASPAAKDAHWFRLWATVVENESAEFEERLSTETARAKYKAHKRYLDNVIEGIKKAADQIETAQ